ncbi:MAG: hypothetical protein HYT28_00990 [Parcubacteria group bacterium]|nr:hypothetical protein [Parcubacteria group bacterium]
MQKIKVKEKEKTADMLSPESAQEKIDAETAAKMFGEIKKEANEETE